MGKCKSAELSKSRRKSGNESFEDGKLESALLQYNGALLVAPWDSEEFYLALSNRTALFLKLKHFQACERDANRILSEEGSRVISARVKEKVQVRKNKAQKQFAECQESSADKKIQERGLPLLFHGGNEHVPALSSAVKVNFSDSKGRHLVATKDIPLGSVILVERPYGSVLLDHCSDTHCHNCHLDLPLDPMPCQNCSEIVWFCSEGCRDEAWQKYHWAECGSVTEDDRLQSLGIGHLALRLLLLTEPQHLVDYVPGKERSNIEGMYGSGDGERYKSGDYRTVASLESHHAQTLPEDVNKYEEVAKGLTKVLKKKKYFEKTKFPDSEEAEGEMVVEKNLLRIIEQLICNAHAISKVIDTVEKRDAQDRVVNEFVSDATVMGEISPREIVEVSREMKKIATALYPTGSLMNHACRPNVFSSFVEGRTLVLRTVRNIRSGEELFICYGPRVGRMRTEERKAALLQQYFFECTCAEVCTNPDEQRKELEAVAYLCRKCKHGPAVPVTFLDSEQVSGGLVLKLRCLDCRSKYDFDRTDFESDVVTWKLRMEFGDDRPDTLRELLNKMGHVYHPMNRTLAENRDKTAAFFCSIGFHKESLEILEDNLRFVEHTYGTDSIEVGEEVMKIVDILKILAVTENGSGNVTEKLRKFSKRGAEIFSVHYGSDYNMTLELMATVERLDTVMDQKNG